MKNLIAAFMLSFLSFASFAQDEVAKENQDGPKMEFKETKKDFGDITQGDKVAHTFVFTNTGNKPLILTNVRTTCGCTATNWTKDPIPPGKTGEIAATFNSAGKMGNQNKIITVNSNAVNSPAHVSIVTNVLPKETESAPAN